MIVVIGALVKTNQPVDNDSVSPTLSPSSGRIPGQAFPAIAVVGQVTRVSLLSALDNVMATDAAINWTSHNLDWTLLSGHTEISDVGGRSQRWEIVLISGNSALIAEVQEGQVISASISDTSDLQTIENGNQSDSTPGDYNQIIDDPGNMKSTSAAAWKPLDSTIIMSAVTAVDKIDMNEENTLLLIDYDGSSDTYLVQYHDPTDSSLSFKAKLRGDTGDLISNERGR
jgi:hypothetical protein